MTKAGYEGRKDEKMKSLLESKGMSKIDDGNGAVSYNSTKADIQSAIDCLRWLSR